MLTLRSYIGEKREMRFGVGALGASAAPSPTSPQYKVLLDGVEKIAWGTAVWDGTAKEIYFLFDTTSLATASPGEYQVLVRCTINSEVYGMEDFVTVL
jgi:hypothetical protein